MSGYGPEVGNYVLLQMGEHTVTKTTRPLYTHDQATEKALLLGQYVEALADEPVRVPPVTDISIHPAQDFPKTFSVRHTMGRIHGPNIRHLPEPAFRPAIARVVGVLCSMSTIPSREPGVLRVPVDGSMRNWHMDGDEPVLVDIFPPLVRDEHQRIAGIQAPVAQRRAEAMHGRLGGLIPELLAAAAPALSKAECRDWCLDMLPSDISQTLRQHLTRQTDKRLDELFR